MPPNQEFYAVVIFWSSVQALQTNHLAPLASAKATARGTCANPGHAAKSLRQEDGHSWAQQFTFTFFFSWRQKLNCPARAPCHRQTRSHQKAPWEQFSNVEEKMTVSPGVPYLMSKCKKKIKKNKICEVGHKFFNFTMKYFVMKLSK